MNVVELMRDSNYITDDTECYIHIECRHDLHGSHQYVRGGEVAIMLNLAKLASKVIVDEGFPLEFFLKMMTDEIMEKRKAERDAEEC